jgi:hypothetical protein
MKKLTLKQTENKIKEYILEINEPIIDIRSFCAGMGDNFGDFGESLYDICERKGRECGYFVVTISSKLESSANHGAKKYLVSSGFKVTVEV